MALFSAVRTAFWAGSSTGGLDDVRKLPSLGIPENPGLNADFPARIPGIYWAFKHKPQNAYPRDRLIDVDLAREGFSGQRLQALAEHLFGPTESRQDRRRHVPKPAGARSA